MKRTALILIITSLAFGGRFGVGFAGGGQYDENYETITPEMLETLFYGGEVYIQAEALPNVFLKPSVSYLNNPTTSSAAAGVGLGLNIQPKLANFPIVPSFGIEGTMLLYNELNLTESVRAGHLQEYIETSTPKLMGVGFAGFSLCLGDCISIDCRYRYHSFSPQYGVEMIWAGLSYYINW